MTTETQANKVEKYDKVGMATTQRCDRCGAQAYLEVRFKAEPQPGIHEESVRAASLMFCAHHANTSETAIFMMNNVTIYDHRPFLALQENQPT